MLQLRYFLLDVRYLSVLAVVVSRPHINHACLYSLQYRVKSIYSMWQTKVMSCSFVIYGSTLDINHQLWPSLTSLMFCMLIWLLCRVVSGAFV